MDEGLIADSRAGPQPEDFIVADGDVVVENVWVRVIVTDGHRIQRYELFDICDTDRALARFEELCTELPQPRPSVAALRIRELG